MYFCGQGNKDVWKMVRKDDSLAICSDCVYLCCSVLTSRVCYSENTIDANNCRLTSMSRGEKEFEVRTGEGRYLYSLRIPEIYPSFESLLEGLPYLEEETYEVDSFVLTVGVNRLLRLMGWFREGFDSEKHGRWAENEVLRQLREQGYKRS